MLDHCAAFLTSVPGSLRGTPVGAPPPTFRSLKFVVCVSMQDSPLKVLMSHYEKTMGLSGHKLSFFFDGTKLSGKELPADLGMESGDLIEVWG